jgi:hypothetical protein
VRLPGHSSRRYEWLLQLVRLARVLELYAKLPDQRGQKVKSVRAAVRYGLTAKRSLQQLEHSDDSRPVKSL